MSLSMGFIMSSIKIRDAMKSDAKIICDMAAALSAHEGVTDPRFTPADFEKYGFGEKKQFNSLVAELGEQVIGYLIFCDSFHIGLGTPGFNILDLFVGNEFRRNGVGKKLLSALSLYCIETGGTWITWQCQPKNETALHFYRAIGGRQYTSLDFELTDSALSNLAKMA